MINHVTKGIRISVKTIYDGSYFKNYNLHFAFNYIIKITNQSKSTVQLKSRHWRIFDSLSSDIIIDGEGVIGEKPSIKPGDSYEYSSGCLITSPVGAMRGFYNMIDINNGKKFRAYIPTFKLTAPQALN
ncbi:MAG: Co2+/Mg2+ efflux protein ApaG [Flavobacteriaceae bacterium]|jgi:ApaG protein|nr:Co2+/Mg2+ efflux protein ApaG [Flavobacteriaceae bacterium]RCL65799.1 MAG: Co2+/Mg2+ efflux protein ApaG [Cryomorphaceae bacterium]|tara:strand:+ start:147 stop:533 length:387 start_codon:yes stop_codon:yes gene_type:complete